MLKWGLRVVGGAWDGAPGMSWIDDGEHELPEAIRVGLCPKGVNCGTSVCRPAGEHVSFWLPDEAGQPLRLTLYEKTEEHVRRDDAGELSGVATYVVGGLPPLVARELGQEVGGPLVTAMVPPATCAGGLPRLHPAPRCVWAPIGLEDGRHDRGWPR